MRLHKNLFCSAVAVNYNTSTNECFGGFKSELQKKHHDYHSRYVYLQSAGESNRTQNIKRQCEFLEQLVSQYPDERIGFVCYCDNMGIEMFEACNQLGLKVPEEIGIIGLGNLNTPLPTGGYLSSIDYNLKKSSSAAAKTLINLIQNRKSTTPFHCEGTLLARDTTSASF